MASKARVTTGLVREAYSKWERRSPLTPTHAASLVKRGVRVLVQPSHRRIFSDAEYLAAGAELSEDLSAASVIFGVKQVPIAELLPNRTYCFFSHVIKAQPENMDLLDALLERNIRLVDYECITRDGVRGAPREIAFGKFAGLAGQVTMLRALGERLLAGGYSTPFTAMGSAYMYPSLDAARAAVVECGESIAKHGLPDGVAPLTFVFTGDGNVSRGAQEIFALLPHEWVTPAELAALDASSADPHKVYGCVVDAPDMVRRVEGGAEAFNFQEYINHPELYESIFATEIAPHASVIMNCAYWDARYPKVLSNEQLAALPSLGGQLLGVGDISCDIGGGIEFLTRSTTIEAPFFTFDPVEGIARAGIDATNDGVAMMGVDILPSELPREASQYFGDLLLPYVEPLSTAASLDALPPALRGAVVTDSGSITPTFDYINKMRRERERGAKLAQMEEMASVQGSSVFRLNGHLFDTGLINESLDVVERFCENDSGTFAVISAELMTSHCGVDPTSQALVQVSLNGGRDAVEELLGMLRDVAASKPVADATVGEMPWDFCSGDFGVTGVAVSTENGASGGGGSTVASASDNGPVEHALLLGAGLVAAPAAELLSRKPNRIVTVVSSVPGEATALVKRLEAIGRTNVHAETWQREDAADGSPGSRLSNSVADSNLVVSLLPASMHLEVANVCIRTAEEGGAAPVLITASYIDEAMEALDERAKAAGVTILAEMGLDPGMDHMSAMKVIHEVQERGDSIVAFSSVCGGLPAPEAADNPFGYKFSWSPRGVLSASGNSAMYLENGKEMVVEGADLLSSVRPSASLAGVLPALALEELPNRNSIPYGAHYGIDATAKTVYRGTLRYNGFCDLLDKCRDFGLLETTNGDATLPATWGELVESLSSSRGGTDAIDTRLRASLDWLDAMGDRPLNAESAASAPIDVFCALLEEKLTYAPQERDLCLMHHEFGVELKDGGTEVLTSTLLAYGEDDNERWGGEYHSSMSKTVGLTAAIGGEVVLKCVAEGSLGPGVHMPTMPAVYVPALAQLEEEGYIFSERVARRTKAAKKK